MNVVVSLVFLMPIIYAILDSIKNKSFKHIDLVLISSIGVYLLTSKFPNFEINIPFFIALGSPIFSALSLYYYKNHIQINSFKETVSVVIIRNILTLIMILILFPMNFELSNHMSYLYSILYGFFILGIAMMTFFHASKSIDSKVFTIVSNIEFLIAFFIMIYIENLSISTIQLIGLSFSFISLIILKIRNLNLYR